ncbi:MAG: hypothetical protein RM368_14060 [Nostoc sp. DedSLP03]|nr:hypothetical protein [Nostoc sp. DedSLP03]
MIKQGCFFALGTAIALRSQLSFASCSRVMLKFYRLVSTILGLDYIGMVIVIS